MKKIQFMMVALAGLLVIGLQGVPSAFACSCIMPRAPQEELMSASAVFAGRVIEQEVRQGFAMSSADPVEVTIAVSEVWKGNVAAKVNITTARDSASCGYNFEDDAEYLVYANGTKNELTVSLCSRTALLDSAEEDLAAFGEGQAPTATPDLESNTKLHPVVIFALSTLGFLFFAGVVYVVKKSAQKKTGA